MSERFSVLAIDGSSDVGVCWGAPGQDPAIDVWRLRYDRNAIGEMLLDLSHRIRSVIVESRAFGNIPIKRSIIERPIINVKTPNLVTTRKLCGIAGVWEMVCFEMGVSTYEIEHSAWKKVFCGRGNVSKKEVPYPPMVRCDQLGWRVNGTDQADACGIWATYIASLNDPSSEFAIGALFA